MDHSRPSADQLLARITEAEHRETRAHFKIFFGASAGVGKTYAMLLEARERQAGGIGVVAGVVETHGRPETAALLEGIERLPPRHVEYRGTTLHEFDIDAALKRAPALLLLDELAHTNAPGSRHAKRWQDVEELLDAGIDVYTTLNVQHVDSLNDVIAQITGVTVRETVPDSILDRADEIELVDIPPDDLIQRLREGKVYVPQQADRALESFFRKGNLIALRELALRKTAERVDAQLESHRRLEGISGPWDVRERLLVCVGDFESGLGLVREARRMTTGLRAEWFVVHVERPGELRPGRGNREKIVDLLTFANELGAQTAILSGHHIADELLSFARDRHVSKILLGKPRRPRWLERLTGSLVSELIRASQDVDVWVVDAQRESAEPRPTAIPIPRSPARAYASAVVAVGVSTAIAMLLATRIDRANLVMVYLIGVVLTAVRFGRGPGVLASVLGVAAFDFFLVPPPLTFAVSDTQYLITFAVMLGTSLVVSTLAVRLRDQAEEARRRERRTAALYALSRDLADAPNEVALVEAAVARVRETFDCDAVVFLLNDDGRVGPRTAARSGAPPDAREPGVVQWVFDHRQPAGRGTATLPSARGLYEPLETTRGAIGVLGVYAEDARRFASPNQVRLLETFAQQIALSLERVQLAADAEQTHLRAERERMRNALLSSVSHDLRTPLATITGATTTLLQPTGHLSEPMRRDLLRSVADEARRLNRLVANLLEMTRVEAGGIAVRKDWHSIEEVVGVALSRLEDEMGGRRVELEIPPDLPLTPFDEISIEQVLVNLLENAVKYSPPDSPITVHAEVSGSNLVVEVLDRGAGINEGEEELVFEKFYRGKQGSDPGGIGLGLAICRAIVTAHGGTLDARRRPGGGSIFRFSLPLGAGAPPAPAADVTLSAES
jgi:two-component system, OmpR family, sensor histidine kinase KdpD